MNPGGLVKGKFSREIARVCIPFEIAANSSLLIITVRE